MSYDDNMIDLIQWRVCIGCYYGNGCYGHGRKTLPGGQHQNVSCGGVKLTLGIFTLGTNILFIHTPHVIICIISIIVLALIYLLTLTDFGVLILHTLYERVSYFLVPLKMLSLFVHWLMLIVTSPGVRHHNESSILSVVLLLLCGEGLFILGNDTIMIDTITRYIIELQSQL